MAPLRRLIIAETASSTWSYHLRILEPGEEPKYGGGAGFALCGAKVGWDTQMPMSAWDKKVAHIPESFCVKCELEAAKRGFTVAAAADREESSGQK